MTETTPARFSELRDQPTMRADLPDDESKRLEQIRARAEAATIGPWEVRGIEIVRDSEGLPSIQSLWVADIDPVSADAAFIAAAREDVPYLLGLLAEKDATIVKPSRDDVARAMYSAVEWPGHDDIAEAEWGSLNDDERETWRVAGDSLALLPGRTEAEVKAEALREAAAELVRAPLVQYHQPTVWLHARAAGIEFADAAERGEGRG